MYGFIDGYDFGEMEAMKYYAPPSTWSDEKKRDNARTKIYSGDWYGAEKKDGYFAKLIKDEDSNIILYSRSRGVNGKFADKHEWVPHLQPFFDSLPNGACLLGELYLPSQPGSKNITTIMGCLKEKAIDILNKMCQIMTSRYTLLSNSNCRNIEEYNKQTSDKMCYYTIIVDELADLFIQAPDIKEILCRLAQLGRAAGIHLILATQRPDRETITGRLKVNIPSRLALTVASVYDSRIILDQTGAEKLTGKGDFILKMANGETVRGQGALIKDINKLLEV